MEENADQAVQEQPSPATPSEWLDIWIKAVTRPKLETYQEISRRADIKTAYLWLGIAIYSSVMVMVFFGLLTAEGMLDSGIRSLIAQFQSFGFPCGFMLYTGVGVAIVSVTTTLSNATAKALGGGGNFCQLVYCATAHFVPRWIALTVFWAALTVFFLLTQLSGLTILFGLFCVALTIYGIVLNVIAIKAVHQLKVWQAVVSAMAGFGLILVVEVCIFTLIPLDWQCVIERYQGHGTGRSYLAPFD